jgi:anti-sigma factor RsiW
MTHDQVAQLLGAFALDAVDADEAEAIRLHLAECPRCASEVAEHWEVTGLIANVGVDAPPELWDRIAARIDHTRPDLPRPAPLSLAARSSVPTRAGAAARRRWTWSAVGAIAAAAAVAVVLLAVQVGRLDQRIGHVAAASRQSGLAQAVQAALLDPSAHKVTLAAETGAAPGTGAPAALVVVLPDGSGYMLNTGLPRLVAGRTYQLWGVANGRTVSLGLLGSQPRDVAFRVDPSAPVTVFAVTDEVAGGVVRSTHAPVAESPTTA